MSELPEGVSVVGLSSAAPAASLAARDAGLRGIHLNALAAEAAGVALEIGGDLAVATPSPALAAASAVSDSDTARSSDETLVQNGVGRGVSAMLPAMSGQPPAAPPGPYVAPVRRASLVWIAGPAIVVAGIVIVLVLTRDGDGKVARTTRTTRTAPATTREPRVGTTQTLPSPRPTSAGGVTSCDDASGQLNGKPQFARAPAIMIDLGAEYSASIETTKGTIEIALFATDAPVTVNNFVFLARCGFYDGLEFHRVAKDFVIQTGDPTGTGSGGPGYTIPDELPSEQSYKLGVVAMANAGPDTGGSQFFIVTGANAGSLPAAYAIFGRVREGEQVAKAIEQVPSDPPNDGRPVEEVAIVTISIVEGGELVVPVGIETFDVPDRSHREETIRYDRTPPGGGPHASTVLTCGIYDEPVPNESAVHSLEHGAVWITYRPDLPPEVVASFRDLRRLYRGVDRYIIVSPYPELPAPVVATFWGHQLKLESPTNARIAEFVEYFLDNGDPPEPGAVCRGVGNPIG